ncbi:MAG: hypothetical protein VB081_05590 [Christensenella sp.]|uniref:hypothetical protein n=1 Tax=Christensenella sp. TaxID=1935934 RepID=UPI002B1EA72F|nr:hypothetical protein [Christensenella sp.]MEA5002953.1 hypothetical protein [Christensenella sp.]
MKIRNIQTLRIWRYILEWFTFAGMVFLVAFFALTAGILPSPPPVAGDPEGLVSVFGMKLVLFVLFLLGSGTSGALFLLSRFPRLFHYPVKITADNIESQYHLAKIALCVGQVIVAAFFCTLMARVYTQSITFESFEFRQIVATALICTGAMCVVYYLAARHFR